jgi:hypothetical protein
LKGNFEINCEFRTGALEDFHFMYGAEHVAPRSLRTGVRIGSVRHDWYSEFESQMVPQGTWTQCRIVVRDGRCLTWFNGRLMRERMLAADHDPWLAFRTTSALRQPSFRNFRIDGTPTVPDEVNRCGDSRLYGWWSWIEKIIGDGWTRADAEFGTGLTGLRQPQQHGTHSESLLCYYRPLAEDGVLNYEFFAFPTRYTFIPL